MPSSLQPGCTLVSPLLPGWNEQHHAENGCPLCPLASICHILARNSCHMSEGCLTCLYLSVPSSHLQSAMLRVLLFACSMIMILCPNSCIQPACHAYTKPTHPAYTGAVKGCTNSSEDVWPYAVLPHWVRTTHPGQLMPNSYNII